MLRRLAEKAALGTECGSGIRTEVGSTLDARPPWVRGLAQRNNNPPDKEQNLFSGLTACASRRIGKRARPDQLQALGALVAVCGWD